MTTGHNFWDAGVWSLMIELTILLVGMLTANMLRRLIKPLRQSLKIGRASCRERV